jgi:hypothetical protein
LRWHLEDLVLDRPGAVQVVQLSVTHGPASGADTRAQPKPQLTARPARSAALRRSVCHTRCAIATNFFVRRADVSWAAERDARPIVEVRCGRDHRIGDAAIHRGHERKKILRRLIPRRSSFVLFADYVEARGCDFYRLVCGRDLEGIVAKWKAAPYRPDIALSS